MGRRSGLGRGLGALIPAEVKGDGTSELRELPVGVIRPNPHQPRTTFDEEGLDELTASVRELGVLQPILVRPVDGEEVYELVAGERRWRAAKRAGQPTIPALVRAVDDNVSLAHALVENIQRRDLNPIETAAAYQQLIEEFGLTHDEVADRVGKSRASVTNALRLFQLPPAVQKLLVDARLGAGHARALLGTPDRAFQEALAKRAVAEGLSVRAVEEAVRDREGRGEPTTESADSGSTTPSTGGGKLRPPGLLELEKLLSRELDTRVQIEMTAKRGKVVVEFADLEDLERIYRAITD